MHFTPWPAAKGMDPAKRWYKTTRNIENARLESDPMNSADLHIRREVAVSMAINTVFSGAFFLAVFGLAGPVPVWGLGHYVFDFGPQAFAVAFMGTLVPSALSRKALRAGRVASRPSSLRLPTHLLLRALVLAAPAAVVALAGAAAAFAVLGVAVLGWGVALAIKLAVGAGLALVITTLALRATLAEHVA